MQSRLLLPLVFACGSLLSACSPEEKTLRELSTTESTVMCNAYVDESRNCMGFDMRCLDQVQGVCTRKQLIEMCLEGLQWSTCPESRFRQCYEKMLCEIQDDAGVLPCFVQCMTESMD